MTTKPPNAQECIAVNDMMLVARAKPWTVLAKWNSKTESWEAIVSGSIPAREPFIAIGSSGKEE